MKNIIQKKVGQALDGLLGNEIVSASEVRKCLSGVATELSHQYARDIPRRFSIGREVRKVGYATIRSQYKRKAFGDWIRIDYESTE